MKTSSGLTISNATVWVTGASSGIGKALVHQLAQANNFIIISGRNEASLSALAASAQGNIVALPFDVADASSHAMVKARLEALTDHIDIAILCAGTCEYDDGPTLDENMYKRVMDTNFFGAVNTVRLALPFLQSATKNKVRRPKIVAVSSMACMAAFPRAEAYGASKAALEYFIQSLAVDLKSQQIDVAIVRPGFVDTPLTRKNDFDMPWLMAPEEAANRILRNLKKNKLFIHFPWPMAMLLGVAKLFPSLWLHYIAPKLTKKEAF
ncbi:SDR family NAD(P)-dependent oxidoreductase [Saccharophagus degradans]|uniref:SDR family NAD(P)-dependent oxidoreductase n=1 Tax=Saccharophagus degradans TaxID=86304 RepID=A0AAW7XD64_9GAMM|nr:SDR family NAD(P)-dependent oxidoreductase [Saccharophagus degradans]MBU2986395.1 SDR family NAD(P)-dependent oxidoreductase [Saccharophagus degradans]MDO6424468.1 SDR family NAD(P)-dependent oxidoreductase [Saccharophagus degradans]MDO6608909.1 SDR family NAD(P)-dependent oxidoreductase [Saccharophagus degradans]